MTHDELLAEIDSLNDSCSVADRLAISLRAVVELHKPQHFIGDDEIYCACSLSPLISYPCSTIQAIEKELK